MKLDLDRFSSNVLALVSGQLVSKAILLVWMGFVARSLGAALFGELAVVMAAYAMVSYLPDLGTGIAVVRRTAGRPGVVPGHLTSLLVLRATLGLSAALLLIMVFHLAGYGAQLDRLIWITALYLLLGAVANIGDPAFSALERQAVNSATSMLSASVTAATGTTLLVAGWGVAGVLWGYVAGAIAQGVVYAVALRRAGVFPAWPVDWRLSGELLKEGMAIGGISAIQLAAERVDRLLIAGMVGKQAAGIYNAGAMLVGPLVDVVWIPFVVTLFPVMSRLHSTRPEALPGVLRCVTSLVHGITVPLAFLLLCNPEPLMVLLFGPEFIASGAIFALLMAALPFSLGVSTFTRILLVRRESRRYFLDYAGGIVLTLALDVALIPLLGPAGAAVAVIASQLILFIRVGLETNVFRDGSLSLASWRPMLLAVAAIVAVSTAGRGASLGAWPQLVLAAIPLLVWYVWVARQTWLTEIAAAAK